MKKIIIIFIFLIVVNGCKKADSLVSPFHFSILPRPQNVTVNVDSTNKKYKIFIRWEFADTSNLKNFEIHRSIKTADNFRLIPPATRNFVYVDSTLPTFSDKTLTVYYKVFPNGFKIDPKTQIQLGFLGPESEMQTVVLTKLN